MGKLRRTVRKSKKRQRGGMASVSFSTPFNQRQPTEAIMEWATTAGISTQSGPQMINVAHGGGTRRGHRKHKGPYYKRTHHKRTRRNKRN